jgi:hypothetical protein
MLDSSSSEREPLLRSHSHISSGGSKPAHFTGDEEVATSQRKSKEETRKVVGWRTNLILLVGKFSFSIVSFCISDHDVLLRCFLRQLRQRHNPCPVPTDWVRLRPIELSELVNQWISARTHRGPATGMLIEHLG